MFASFAAIVLGAGLVAQPAPEPTADSLLKLLRQGGYVVMLRHTHTDRSVQEAMGYVDPDRAKQRNLSGLGVLQARMIGAIMRQNAIPFGAIVASPMFRTVETAELAFGKPDTSMRLRELAKSPEQLALLTKKPAHGTNRALVTHHFIIEGYAPGIRPGDIDEGEAVVLRADEGAFTLIGRFKLDDWRRLAPPGHAIAAPTAPAGAHAAPQGGANLPVVRLTSAYIRAFNTGNADSMRVFVESSMATEASASTLNDYRTLFADHGPLTVSSHGMLTHAELRLNVKSRRGELVLTVKPDSVNAERLRSVSLSPTGSR